MKDKTYEAPCVELWHIQFEGVICISSDDCMNEFVGENQGSWNF